MARGYAGRKPGTMQVNTARFEIVRALVAALAPEERGGAGRRGGPY